MTYLEILGLIVSGAGTLASILGIFFAMYAKQNGQATRALITSQNNNMREFIASENKEMREFLSQLITSQNKEMREFLSELTISQNKEMRNFTAEVLAKLDEHADGRHREIMEMLKR